jgi:outer membrane protein
MKRSLVVVATLALGFALSAAAQTLPAPVAPAAAPAGPAKIALIAFQPVVQRTNEFQRNLADLEKKFAPREAQLKALDEEVAALTKKLQEQGSVLSDTERASIAKSAEEKKKKLDRDAEDLKNDGGQEMQEMLISVAGKVSDVMIAYAQQQGFTMVLDESQQQVQILLWADGSADISKAVLDAYNVKSGVPAPPPPPAATAKPTAPKPAAH